MLSRHAAIDPSHRSLDGRHNPCRLPCGSTRGCQQQREVFGGRGVDRSTCNRRSLRDASPRGQLVEQYLQRIALYEDKPQRGDHGQRRTRLKTPTVSTPSVSREGARTAARYSRSRSRTTCTPASCRRPAGRLHSTDLFPPYEATLTKNLRDAGAIILAKTILTELANWVANGMPGNYSALEGYGLNPYDPRRDPRPAPPRPAPPSAVRPRREPGCGLRRASTMGGRLSGLEARAPAPGPPQISGRPMSAPRRRDRF